MQPCVHSVRAWQGERRAVRDVKSNANCWSKLVCPAHRYIHGVPLQAPSTRPHDNHYISGDQAPRMDVAAFTTFGGPGGVEIIDRPVPEAGAGQAIVGVKAASLNRHDLWILEGDSAMVAEETLPFVSGLDLAGVVRETRDDSTVSVGDRVVLCPNQTCGTCELCREGPENRCASFSLYHGAFAEQAAVDASRLIALPDEVSFSHGAALPTAYLTAWHMLRRAGVGAGDLILIPGATGGVGVAAIQLAALQGAQTIGTSTSRAKLARLAELGCDEVVQSADPEEIVREVEPIGPVDAVLNHLAGEFVQAGLSVLKRDGRQVICGRTADTDISFPAAPFFLQHQSLVGSTMGTQPELASLVDLVATGNLDPVVSEVYPLADTDRAFEAMQTRDAFGKLIVKP